MHVGLSRVISLDLCDGSRGIQLLNGTLSGL